MFYLKTNEGFGMPMLLFYGAIFLIMYFFFLRPQVKKQKAQNSFSSALKKGDEVVTGSGIIGKISKIEDDIIHLEIAQKTFIKVLKGAISREMTEAMRKPASDKA
ncbi:MAG: preprotein translocase subunit YajC [Saprospiraceae bacterium]|nr:preprotein translocase subunit YajC [Bacteroidia bacterium]NNE16267.1 preprotein translocase subunit YajC [Saprospiraceae bacterium]NNL90692.1 preprotein translocase subunit YajC [Saprospiraceae bacterium]